MRNLEGGKRSKKCGNYNSQKLKINKIEMLLNMLTLV